MLWELASGGASAFTIQCRAVSECDTALRGGDLAGDLGWLDRDEKKNRKVPGPVVRAAFTLNIGQLSDVVASERGVHLLLRTA
jgi:parvulin-like peptidyl-prolyl isomerase